MMKEESSFTRLVLVRIQYLDSVTQSWSEPAAVDERCCCLRISKGAWE